MNNCEMYTGQKLGGRYEILNVVGIGGMSVVYGAYDEQGKRPVAVKVFDDSQCADSAARDEAVLRFENEARIMSALSHPNIVNITDCRTDGEPKYFVMEYVEANTLKRRIADCGALPPYEVLHYTVQILRALIHTHGRGIVHCDVKPQNIMLLSDGNIKLTDFGIARGIDSPENRESDTAVGTVYYISPEQASGKPVDGRSDLYSLGVMMYEMATGRLPFSGEDTDIVTRKHIESVPVRPRTLDPEIPKGLEQMIMHAMEKLPFMRFSDAKEMLEAAELLENDMRITFSFGSAPEETQETRQPAHGHTRGLSGRLIALAGAGLSFVVIALATVIIAAVIAGGSGKVSVTVPELEGSVWYGSPAAGMDGGLYNIKIKYVIDPSRPENTVISQSVKPGSRRKVSEQAPLTMTLTVSRTTDRLIMGDYSVMPVETVRRALENLGYNVVITQSPSDYITAGYVISTSPPAGETAKIGQTVTVTVSTGKQKP